MEDMAKVYSKQEEPMDLDREELTDMTTYSQIPYKSRVKVKANC